MIDEIEIVIVIVIEIIDEEKTFAAEKSVLLWRHAEMTSGL